jgi:hypothetical protein
MERALQEGKEVDEQLTQLALDEITPALQAGESAEQDASEDEGEEEDEASATPRASRSKRSSENRVSR